MPEAPFVLGGGLRIKQRKKPKERILENDVDF